MRETLHNIFLLVAWSLAIPIAIGLAIALVSFLWPITLPIAVAMLYAPLRNRITNVFTKTVQTTRAVWHETSPRTKEERRIRKEQMPPMPHQQEDMLPRPIATPDAAVVDCHTCDVGYVVLHKSGNVQPCPRCNAANVDEHSRTPRARNC